MTCSASSTHCPLYRFIDSTCHAPYAVAELKSASKSRFPDLPINCQEPIVNYLIITTRLRCNPRIPQCVSYCTSHTQPGPCIVSTTSMDSWYCIHISIISARIYGRSSAYVLHLYIISLRLSSSHTRICCFLLILHNHFHFALSRCPRVTG